MEQTHVDQPPTPHLPLPLRPSAETLDAPSAVLHRVRLAGYTGDALSLVAPLTHLSEKVAALELAIIAAADRLSGTAG